MRARRVLDLEDLRTDAALQLGQGIDHFRGPVLPGEKDRADRESLRLLSAVSEVVVADAGDAIDVRDHLLGRLGNVQQLVLLGGQILDPLGRVADRRDDGVNLTGVEKAHGLFAVADFRQHVAETYQLLDDLRRGERTAPRCDTLAAKLRQRVHGVVLHLVDGGFRPDAGAQVAFFGCLHHNVDPHGHDVVNRLLVERQQRHDAPHCRDGLLFEIGGVTLDDAGHDDVVE